MTETSVWLTIITIGVLTFGIRYIFLVWKPTVFSRPTVRRGLEAVPVAMLVALVVPYTLVKNQELDIFRIEVLAIGLTLITTWASRKYGLAIVFALSFYVVLDIFI